MLLSSLALSPSKPAENGPLFGHFFDHFLVFFVKMTDFTHFRHFSVKTELSGPRLVKTSWSPNRENHKNSENQWFLSPQNVVPHGVQKTRKNGHCHKPLSKPRGWWQNCKPRGQKKSPKSGVFEKTRKSGVF